MIFVTVGTQLSFDRMIRVVDEWAGASGLLPDDVFAQIGPGEYEPKHIRYARFVDAQAFRRHVAEAELVVAHAGMGSIITALELGKPILVMPRLAERREHRNDHQVGTARRFLAQGRIFVAFDEVHLTEKLGEANRLHHKGSIGAAASPHLIDAIRGFIDDGVLPPAGEMPQTDIPAATARQTHNGTFDICRRDEPRDNVARPL
jgi:UDP-N-acetylglucosamine transferase subunit ALG13